VTEDEDDELNEKETGFVSNKSSISQQSIYYTYLKFSDKIDLDIRLQKNVGCSIQC
jgi:hypothetical protein